MTLVIEPQPAPDTLPRERWPESLRLAVDLYAPRVEHLRDGLTALGTCMNVAGEYGAWLELRDIHSMQFASWAVWLGYDEYVPTPWPQEQGHVVPTLDLDGRIFTVDWTAAQFGRTEFPLVIDWNDGTLLPRQHPWLLTPDQAEQAMREMLALANPTARPTGDPA